MPKLMTKLVQDLMEDFDFLDEGARSNALRRIGSKGVL